MEGYIVMVLFPQEHCIDIIPPRKHYVSCYTDTKKNLNSIIVNYSCRKQDVLAEQDGPHGWCD